MKQEVESRVPVSNSLLYRYRVGEIRENAKRQDGDHRMLSISLLKSIKAPALFTLFKPKVAGK